MKAHEVLRVLSVEAAPTGVGRYGVKTGDFGARVFCVGGVFRSRGCWVAGWVGAAVALAMAQAHTRPMDDYMGLMLAAKAHARAHGAALPVLSPLDETVLGTKPAVDVAALHRAGIKVVPWTTNDPEKMRALMALRVDGIISDRPDVLRRVLREEAAKDVADAAYFAGFDVAAHRGGRGLRPENTLPSFESGLDELSTTLETDTGVTSDGVSLIWHDQFLNPESCRRVDGAAYTFANRVYTRDISLAEAQRVFVCDKLHARFPEQKNELALSPVAVAFAAEERLLSPYVPTYAEQLFRFVRFYAVYYRTGAGRTNPAAAARAENAERVRFNLETKLLPLPEDAAGRPPAGSEGAEPVTNHTVGPQAFVTALCGAIVRGGMVGRAEVQSFDFRTLVLVQEQFPEIPTYYLTE